MTYDFQQWTLQAVGDSEVPEVLRNRDVPATVPGCVHTDRLAARLIPHPRDARAELVTAQAGEQRALWFFGRDKNISYPAPNFEAELEREGNMYKLTVTAKTLLRDVAVFVDRLDPDATVND